MAFYLADCFLGYFFGPIFGLGSFFIFNNLTGVVIGLIGGSLVGFIGGLTGGGIFFGLPIALWFGGFEIIQHYTLRLLFSKDIQLPLELTKLLTYATDRLLLRRVGGGYIFIHRYLLEYLAGTTTD